MKVKGDKHEKKLIAKLKMGDEIAFKCIFDQYKNVVYGYSYMFTKSQVLAEEMVQEVFMKVWKNHSQLDPAYSFKSFIFTVTKHQVYNLLRKAAYDEKLKAEIFYHTPLTHQNTEDQLLSKELEHLKNEAIAILPPQRQLIFRMSRLQNLSHEEIAQQLGLSKNTVKDQIVKAIKSIKEYLRMHADITVSLIFALLLDLF